MKQTALDEKVAKKFDQLIGIYFSNPNCIKEATTLGEFIVASKPIYPDYFDEWMKEEVKF